MGYGKYRDLSTASQHSLRISSYVAPTALIFFRFPFPGLTSWANFGRPTALQKAASSNWQIAISQRRWQKLLFRIPDRLRKIQRSFDCVAAFAADSILCRAYGVSLRSGRAEALPYLV
jgi:hypothetical protein